jgi:hypothetical protein
VITYLISLSTCNFHQIFVRLVRPQTARKPYLQELDDRLHAAFPLSLRNEQHLLLPHLVVEHDRLDQSLFPVSTRTVFPLTMGTKHLLPHLGVEYDQRDQSWFPVSTRTVGNKQLLPHFSAEHERRDQP